MDQEDDFGLISVTAYLKNEKIKLWLAPYYEEGKEAQETLNVLAETISGNLKMPKDNVLQYLKQLQEKSMSNLKDKEMYEKSGVASLKIRAPRREDSPMNLKIAISSLGKKLKEEISKNYEIAENRLKLISHGQLIDDEKSLESQNIKNGSQIMTLIIKADSEDLQNFENNNTFVKNTKKDVQYLAGRKHSSGDLYLQIADQSGKNLELPKKERKALVMAMTLHEKGRHAIKNSSFDLALILLLEAEQEFKQCGSQLLQQVDNYALLSLDLTWCYLNLRSISQLPNAELRLKECENAFHKSYGSNMERLVALKGCTGCEAGLFLRLHLLQAILLYHKGQINEAKVLFEKVEKELNDLKIDDDKLSILVEMGFTITDSRLALRQTRGDVNAAVFVIQNKLQERKRIQQEQNREQEIKKLQTNLGKCANGSALSVENFTLMISMGYDAKIAKNALANSNNDVDNAISFILEHPDGVSGSTSSVVANIDHVSSLGECSKKLQKTKEERLMEEKVFSRVADGIENDMDDYLDFSLTAEEEFLKKYQALIDSSNK